MPQLTPVLVKWYDPTVNTPWEDPGNVQAMELSPMWSLGWLLQDSKKYIKIALSKGAMEDRVSDTLILPKGCVEFVKRVKMPWK